MDKFAVDIDQVLNDFEYSELTDHYSTTEVDRKSNNASGSYPQNHTVTKHSINNVFHSLNEYLNTSINEKPAVTLSENAYGDDLRKIDNKYVDNNNEKTTAAPIVDNSLLESLADVKGESEKTDLLNGCDSKIENLFERPQEESEVDKFEHFGRDNNQKFGDLVEILQERGNASLENNIEAKIIELEEEIENKQEGFEGNIDESDFSEKFLADEENEEINVNCVIVNNLKEESEGEEIRLDAEFESLSNTRESSEEIVHEKENDQASEIVEAIVSENEENLKAETQTEALAESHENENINAVNSEDIVVDTNLTQVSNDLDDAKESIQTEIQTEKTDEIETESEEIIETQPEKTEETAAAESKVEIGEPTNVVGFDDDLNLDDSELDKLLAELELEQEPNEPPECETQAEGAESKTARPQELQLNDDGRRTIDLVGAPGSTPYNNVYVSKEVPKAQPHDSDTDYSTSASPTFSDISTESTSTASTVSVEGVERRKEEGAGGVRVEECRNVAADENGQENVPEGSVVPECSEPESSEQPTNLSGSGDNISDDGKGWIGKQAPLWVPDADATSCLQCEMKFTVLKRRHHCRACGLVLCSKCCYQKLKLEYLDAGARVCNKCYSILNRGEVPGGSASASEASPELGNVPFRPNPGNPSEYCSTVPPAQQAAAGGSGNPPAVMVPVGVLKRKGSNKKHNKSVMFCDGIKPGSDLTSLDNDFDYSNRSGKKVENHREKKEKQVAAAPKSKRNLPALDPETKCFIPNGDGLPPTVTINKTVATYTECANTISVVEMLKNEALTFAINVNLTVHLKIINMSCCINKWAWCFSTEGLMNVGNDELVYLIEYIDEESLVPKDIFFHVHNIYLDAVKGTTIKEMGLSLHGTSNFLGDKNHAGFVYVRPTFQCVENVIQPNEPYLVGILIHRWETPWAKLFPLRLVLRLGAEYRYYPSPLISTRHRESMFVEIGHTIINLLADFRNFSYTIPQVRGLSIHMEDKNTTINIPVNRYEAVMKTINNSSDHILAFASNFSPLADSHLVCIQDTQDSNGTNNNYSTHAINIHNRPRKVTGASFIVFNGALKSSSGLSAKSNIVEDGLMIQVLPEEMRRLRDALRAMKGYTISCGCATGPGDEVVNIVWGDNDTNFNLGIKSPIDKMVMSGIPSIRVHNGKDYVCHSSGRFIRWTEVFILKNGEENSKKEDIVDVSKVSENIAKATCNALVKYLDLLATNSFYKIGIRTTLHVENVSYSAGSNGVKLPPIYMKSLDNELIPVLHRITSNNLGDNHVELELIFRILNV